MTKTKRAPGRASLIRAAAIAGALSVLSSAGYGLVKAGQSVDNRYAKAETVATELAQVTRGVLELRLALLLREESDLRIALGHPQPREVRALLEQRLRVVQSEIAAIQAMLGGKR